jgi:hypothetical protein
LEQKASVLSILFVFCSAIPLIAYKNAQFEPSISSLFLANWSGISSHDQCYFNQQYSLFFARLEEGQICLVSTIKQSNVLLLQIKNDDTSIAYSEVELIDY